VLATLERLGLDALIPIGGEDTLGVATKLAEAGVRVVGVPKTIDNDLDATDYTFGFDTASAWPPRPSTGCTPPGTATTARWSSR
jgi:6-phosphofructokinase